MPGPSPLPTTGGHGQRARGPQSGAWLQRAHLWRQVMLPCWDQGVNSSLCLEPQCSHPSGCAPPWQFLYVNKLTFKCCFIISLLHLMIYCVYLYLSTSINLMVCAACRACCNIYLYSQFLMSVHLDSEFLLSLKRCGDKHSWAGILLNL